MRAPLIVFAVAFLFLGGLFFVIGGNPLLDAWRYRHAVRAEAAATGTTLRRATDTSGTAYEVSYRAVIDGQAHERTDVVPVRVWEQVEAGVPVPIEYLPGRPETVRARRGGSGLSRQSFIFTAIGVLLIVGGLGAASRAMRRRASVRQEPSTGQPHGIPAHESSYWPRARQLPMFWIGAIFLIVGLPFVVASLLQMREEWRFARDGVSTDAMILTKEMTRPGRNRRSRGYEATYRVTVPEGAFENRARLSLEAWSRLQERQPAEVQYLPDWPARSRLAGSEQWLQSAVLGVLGFVTFGVGAAFFRRSIRQAHLEWRLEQRGAAANGTVIEIRDRRLAINGVRQWRLTYEYNDFQSRRYTATHDMPEDEAQLWNVGDIGVVRYDPSSPADAIWLGRVSSERSA